MLIQNLNDYANAVYANNERFIQIRLGNDLYWEAPKSYASTSTLSYSNPLIPASGGTSTPILNCSSTWGYYEKTTGGGSVSSNYTVTYAFKDTAPSTWSIDSATGVITATTMGTTTIAQTPVVVVATVVSNGMMFTVEGVVTQAENTIVDFTGRFPKCIGTVEDISPAGGTVNKYSTLVCTLYRSSVTFSSGSTQSSSYARLDISLDPSLSCITYGDPIIAEDIRYILKERTFLGNLKATIKIDTVSTSVSCNVYQAASAGTGSSEIVTLIVSGSTKITMTRDMTGLSSEKAIITRSDGVALSNDNPLKVTKTYSYTTSDDGVDYRDIHYDLTYNSDGSATVRAYSGVAFYTSDGDNTTLIYAFSQTGVNNSISITMSKTK